MILTIVESKESIGLVYPSEKILCGVHHFYSQGFVIRYFNIDITNFIYKVLFSFIYLFHIKTKSDSDMIFRSS